jgi:hypothetical protein
MAKKGGKKRRAGSAQDIAKTVQAARRQLRTMVSRAERDYRDLEKRVQKQIGQLGASAGKAAAKAKSVATGKKRAAKRRPAAKKAAPRRTAAKSRARTSKPAG